MENEKLFGKNSNVTGLALWVEGGYFFFWFDNDVIMYHITRAPIGDWNEGFEPALKVFSTGGGESS